MLNYNCTYTFIFKSTICFIFLLFSLDRFYVHKLALYSNNTIKALIIIGWWN